jgi:hypothetical protein
MSMHRYPTAKEQARTAWWKKFAGELAIAGAIMLLLAAVFALLSWANHLHI